MSMFKFSGRGLKRFRVKRPKGRNLGDEFYVEVAQAYGLASQFDRSPARLVAEASDVPESTVHRWVKEARRRGVMAPGRAPRKFSASEIAQYQTEPKG